MNSITATDAGTQASKSFSGCAAWRHRERTAVATPPYKIKAASNPANPV